MCVCERERRDLGIICTQQTHKKPLSDINSRCKHCCVSRQFNGHKICVCNICLLSLIRFSANFPVMKMTIRTHMFAVCDESVLEFVIYAAGGVSCAFCPCAYLYK